MRSYPSRCFKAFSTLATEFSTRQSPVAKPSVTADRKSIKPSNTLHTSAGMSPALTSDTSFGGTQPLKRRFHSRPTRSESRRQSTAYHARRSSGGSSGGMQRHKGCLFPSNTPSAESGAAGRLPLPQRQVRTVPAGTTAFLLRQAAYGRFPL